MPNDSAVSQSSKGTDIILDHIDKFKTAIMDAGFGIQTSSPDVPVATQQLHTSLLGTVADYRDKALRTEPAPVEEKLSAQKLYETPGGEADTGQIVRIVNLINSCREYLNTAFSEYDEEVFRENQMALLLANMYEFDYHRIDNQNLYDLLVHLKYSLFTHRERSYGRKEIQGLKQVFDLIRDNLFMSESVLDKCMTLLLKYGIEPAQPFDNIEIAC